MPLNDETRAKLARQDGVRDLQKQGKSRVEASAAVEGLDFVQVRGIVLGLSREQVQVESFSIDTVIAIREATEGAPKMSLQDAYKAQMKSQAPAAGQVRVGKFDVPAPGGPRINSSGQGCCVIL